MSFVPFLCVHTPPPRRPSPLLSTFVCFLLISLFVSSPVPVCMPPASRAGPRRHSRSFFSLIVRAHYDPPTRIMRAVYRSPVLYRVHRRYYRFLRSFRRRRRIERLTESAPRRFAPPTRIYTAVVQCRLLRGPKPRSRNGTNYRNTYLLEIKKRIEIHSIAVNDRRCYGRNSTFTLDGQKISIRRGAALVSSPYVVLHDFSANLRHASRVHTKDRINLKLKNVFTSKSTFYKKKTIRFYNLSNTVKRN